MKLALIAIFALQICPAAAEIAQFDSRRLDRTKQWMERTDRWADDMVLEEIGGATGLIIMKRGETIMGYYYEDYTWAHKDHSDLDLPKITKVTYGAPGPQNQDYTPIEITDAGEIALWIATYKNHTEYQSGWVYFVPLSPKAGFAFAREELDYGGGHLCALGVRFHSDDKVVLLVSGHLHESPSIDWRTRNRPLHLLVKARMPEEEEEKEDDDFEDPFLNPAKTPASDSQAEEEAEKPASVPKSRGPEKPKPESEERSQ